MTINSLTRVAAGAALAVFGFAGVAHADYAFSGSGSTGVLAGASEGWSFNYDGAPVQKNWGSPGVAAGVTAYGQSQDAYGMTITFSGGGTIDASSIAIGNGANCVGSTHGGTTFCTTSPLNIWTATLINPYTINFIAQNSTFNLSQGQNYFVNVFFNGDTPTSFTGKWLTDFTGGGGPGSAVPEPATWAMMIVGFGAVGSMVRTSRRRNPRLAA